MAATDCAGGVAGVGLTAAFDLAFLGDARWTGAFSAGFFLTAVFLAAFLVKEMSLAVVGWLVVAVVLYTGGTMLYSAWSESRLKQPDFRLSGK